MYKGRSLDFACWIFISSALLIAVLAIDPVDRLERKAPSQINVGVGFSLSLDYGTSAVYFPNNTYHTVAKIEGSTAYKQLMREVVNDGIDSYKNVSCWPDEDVQPSWLAEAWLLKAQRAIRQYPVPGPLQKWIPQRAADQLTLERMISALKTATESYIGADVHSVAHSFPIEPACHHEKLLYNTLKSLGLHTTALDPQWVPGDAVAAIANGITQCSSDKKDEYGSCLGPPQRGLFVDYTRAALRMSMFVLSNSYVEQTRFLFLPELGGAAISTHHSADQKYWESVREAIKDFASTKTASNRVEKVPDEISLLVLAGELGFHSQLREALRDVLLNGKLVSNEITNINNGNTGPMFEEVIDPLFAMAVGSAFSSWDERVRCTEPANWRSSWPDRGDANCVDE